MSERQAWLLDANVVSEMMRPRPEPRVAAFLDSMAEERTSGAYSGPSADAARLPRRLALPSFWFNDGFMLH